MASISIRTAATPLRSSERSTLDALLSSGLRRPIGHELLEDARSLPIQAKMVMIMAAIEVGTKEFLAAASPATSWLVRNLPSPPIDNILRKAIPEPREGINSTDLSAFHVPVHLVHKIKHGVEQRNATIHRGIQVDPMSFIDELEDAASELLYLLDRFRGHVWAEAYLSPETLSDLKTLKQN